MTILSITPFRIKPALKRMFCKPKTVNIPTTLSGNLYNIISPMQKSLDYMATNYGIHFTFKQNGLKAVFVACEKNNVTACSKLITENDAAPKIIRNMYASSTEAASNIYEVSPEVARKIYEAASAVL